MQPTADKLELCPSVAHKRIQNDILFFKLRSYYNFDFQFCRLSYSLPSVFPKICPPWTRKHAGSWRGQPFSEHNYQATINTGTSARAPLLMLWKVLHLILGSGCKCYLVHSCFPPWEEPWNQKHSKTCCLRTSNHGVNRNIFVRGNNPWLEIKFSSSYFMLTYSLHQFHPFTSELNMFLSQIEGIIVKRRLWSKHGYPGTCKVEVDFYSLAYGFSQHWSYSL